MIHKPINKPINDIIIHMVGQILQRLVKRAAPSPRRCALTRQTCLRQLVRGI
jgi:hypothetical protein